MVFCFTAVHYITRDDQSIILSSILHFKSVEVAHKNTRNIATENINQIKMILELMMKKR